MGKSLFLTVIYAVCSLCYMAAQGLVNVKHYSVKDGMSQNTVQGVLQDNEGYIWMATWNGLEKFDGYSFKNYKTYPTDKVKLQYNRLVNLQLGGNQMLVCQSYDRRVYLFDIRRECFEDVFVYHPEVKLCTAASKIITLPNGMVWIVGTNGDLWRIDCFRYKDKGGLVYLPTHSDAERKRYVFTVSLDMQGNEWVLTDKGYFVYGNNALKGNDAYRYTASVGKRFFVADSRNKLMEYLPEKGLSDVRLSRPAENIRQIFPLSDGLLGILMKRSFAVYNPADGKSVSLLLDETQEDFQPVYIFQDSKKNIWVQNKFKHIVRLDPKCRQAEFLDYPRRQASEDEACFIHEDEYGHIWAYSNNGFFSYYNPKKHVFQQSYMLNDATKTMYEGINRVYYIDNHKNVWMAQEGGIDRIAFLNTNFEYLNTPSALVRGLYIDSRGRIWVASKDGMVKVYDKAVSYTHLTLPTSITV